jgi:threonylcarbamoyladenosine tRNA methylthiotransferase MtaB
MPNKVALHTLGCKLNFSETSTIGNQFLSNGFEIVDFKDEADVFVLNTCSVTENAEKECRQIIRRALRKNPEAFVVVTGCYAQLRPDEIAKIEGVDLVLGSNEKFKLFSLVNNFDKKNLACVFTSPTEQLIDFGHAFSTDADSRTRAYLKIQDGCDYKCSFCTIPLARGGSRSMIPQNTINAFKNLIDNGYKEVILTGVNVGDYGKNYETNLYSLLLKMIDVPGDFRIRISSIEPNLLTDEIIDLAASSEKLCNHFHIPLQSGSREILRLMRRRYKLEYYENLIYKLQNKIPDVGIGVDVIVGFPSETDEHFKETYKFLNNLPISYLHVFTYSERPNTKAIELSGNVDVFERKKRNNMLRILSQKKRNYFYKSMLNNELNILFESENKDNTIYGFSSNYVKVKSDFNNSLNNSFKKVKVQKFSSDYCEGEMVNSHNNSYELLAS